MKKQIRYIALILLAGLTLQSCYKDEIEFIPAAQTTVYSSETNVDALLRDLQPSVLAFPYANDIARPIHRLKFDAYGDESISFELSPLAFKDRNGNIYRGEVGVSIEFMNKPEHYLRRGINTQLDDYSLLDIDLAVKLIFTDKAGYRLQLRNGLDVELISSGTFEASNIYTLSQPDEGLPYSWKEHPEEESMKMSIHNTTISNQERLLYKFTVLDNQWIALGKSSIIENYEKICFNFSEENKQLLGEDKTLVFAVLNTVERQVIQLHLDREGEEYCTEHYPKDLVSKIVVFGMDNYIDRYYFENFFMGSNTDQLIIKQSKIGRESMIDKLSSI